MHRRAAHRKRVGKAASRGSAACAAAAAASASTAATSSCSACCRRGATTVRSAQQHSTAQHITSQHAWWCRSSSTLWCGGARERAVQNKTPTGSALMFRGARFTLALRPQACHVRGAERDLPRCLRGQAAASLSGASISWCWHGVHRLPLLSTHNRSEEKQARGLSAHHSWKRCVHHARSGHGR